MRQFQITLSKEKTDQLEDYLEEIKDEFQIDWSLEDTITAIVVHYLDNIAPSAIAKTGDDEIKEKEQFLYEEFKAIQRMG